MATDVVCDGKYRTLPEGKSVPLAPEVELRCSPGHTDHDLIVIIRNTKHGCIVVAGDIFEYSNDDEDWTVTSRYPDIQMESRAEILTYADWIIPGHGVPADRGGSSIEDLVIPRIVAPPRTSTVGADRWTEGLDSSNMSLALDEFFRRKAVRELSMENGLNNKLFVTAYKSFRAYCLSEKGGVEPALLVLFQDIVKEGHDVESLFPYFLAHARKKQNFNIFILQVFPHLEAMEDLRMISDLTQPHNWYPDARTVQRKIIFHAGPTNSGKTYHALRRFGEAKSGVYCGPLKLLATEVFTRSNELGIKCDLVTGEERRFAIDNFHPSAHISSTVEMLSTQMRVEVAVIDEIQMLRDEQRGWAWTRALLGVAADEVHLCGESAAIDIVKKLLEPIGEHVEVRHYERKTTLTIASQGLGSLDNVQPGDCIVCFSRKAIFNVTKNLEKLGIKPAVIYGDLPPGTKLAQASKFNDTTDPCNVLVATDAIGMGLNLNIRRIILSSCTRQGELLPNYSALQIIGRAGRYGTTFTDGIATTLRNEDIGTLREILSRPVEPIEVVGIAPTFEQIETFSFHLPQASFVHLLDLFVSVCSISEQFFICTVDQMRALADLIDYIPLPLKVRYTFCISPLNVENKLASSAFVKMVRRFSSGQCLTYDWMMDMLDWDSLNQPENLEQLEHMEKVYEVLDTYLWLSMRFPDMLPDGSAIRDCCQKLDTILQISVENIIELLENSGTVDARKAVLSSL
ncbi:helicase protein [Dictyocaulus viviparus]|uniref:ATP-dependent RNA helicase SUV3 homolog, mitochondrial n=1 Tax=Dictyocaulus viviparus TaxID=29172 RepID=A0A0D8XN03_DICVI|nr:helicase protein [Dictyocaulus viviparus]